VSTAASARYVVTSTAVAAKPVLAPRPVTSVAVNAATAPGNANTAPPAAASDTMRATISARGSVLAARRPNATANPATVIAASVSAVAAGRVRLAAAAHAPTSSAVPRQIQAERTVGSWSAAVAP
jgi:hypothetical protein